MGNCKIKIGGKIGFLILFYKIVKKSNWCRLKMCVEEIGEIIYIFVFIIEEGEENLYVWIEEWVRKLYLREKMKCLLGCFIFLKIRWCFFLS